MNIVIIPSWYPHPNAVYNGIFILEQVKSLTKYYPEHRFFVSLHGAGQFLFSARKFSDWPDLWRNYQQAQSKLPDLKDKGFIEVLTPALQWSDRIFQGNLAGLIKAHRRNLKYIDSLYGPVDLIHAHVTFPAGQIAWHLARELNLPWVLTEHMGPFPFDKPQFIRHGKLMPLLMNPLKATKAIVAVSHSLAKDIKKFDVDNVQVIPNGVDTDSFKPLPKASLSSVFLCVAHLSPRKGIHDLLVAMKQVVAIAPQARLQIIGGGDTALYQVQIQELNIEKQVQLIGALPNSELAPYYQQARAFILPSYNETFGVCYIEALACGIPIIATRCGGPEDIVTPFNGYLVDVAAPQQLAQAMLEILSHPERFDSAVIREDCLERFSFLSVTKKLMALYLEVRGLR